MLLLNLREMSIILYKRLENYDVVYNNFQDILLDLNGIFQKGNVRCVGM